MVTLPDCVGFNVSINEENVDIHAAGAVELTSNVLAVQPVESLFVTVTV